MKELIEMCQKLLDQLELTTTDTKELEADKNLMRKLFKNFITSPTMDNFHLIQMEVIRQRNTHLGKTTNQ